MANFDDLKLTTEALSGGKNTVLLDDMGMPSVMVKVPKFKISDVITGGTDIVHPAFVVDGVEKDAIYISKYQNIVVNDRAYSLPGKDPRATVTFDQAKTYSENKGAGWHLMTNAEWAAIALWCKKNGFMPRGNNNYGSDTGAAHEKGVMTYMADATKIGRVATGSGPASWAHDNTNNGIFDMNGNVNEWVAGWRLVAGEIQVIPYNNAAKSIDQGASSLLWKAIAADGSLVDPGTADTLKWDYANSKITLCKTITTQADASRSTAFESLAVADGVTVPEILKALAIHPADANSHGGDTIYMNNGAGLERLPFRGGGWNFTSGAGVFYAYLLNPRSFSYSNIGFRSAYVL